MALGQNMAKRKAGGKTGVGAVTKPVGKTQEEPSSTDVKARNSKKSKKSFEKPNSGKKTMLLEGELDVNNVYKIREKLLVAIDANDDVEIRLENVTQLDLSCIQLLYNVSRAYSDQGKNITVDAELSAEILDVITNSGLSELLFKSTKTKTA